MYSLIQLFIYGFIEIYFIFWGNKVLSFVVQIVSALAIVKSSLCHFDHTFSTVHLLLLLLFSVLSYFLTQDTPGSSFLWESFLWEALLAFVGGWYENQDLGTERSYCYKVAVAYGSFQGTEQGTMCACTVCNHLYLCQAKHEHTCVSSSNPLAQDHSGLLPLGIHDLLPQQWWTWLPPSPMCWLSCSVPVHPM